MYENIIARVYNQPHLIHPDKLEAIRRVVTARALGLTVDAASIAAARAERQAQQKDTRFLAAAGSGGATSVQRSVAVLPIMGTLAMRMDMMEEASGGASTEAIGRQFDALMKDDTVGCILLNVHSPGGEGFGITELANKIFNARGQKPVCAICNAEMASAALWLGLAANEVSITPSGWIGSLGVYLCHTDLSAQNEELGRKVTYISAGKYKTEMTDSQPLPADAQAYYQSMVDDIYDGFVTDVARFRGTSQANVKDNYGQGRMMRADQAMKCGMVDRVETFDDCLARLSGARAPKAKKSAKAELERRRLELLR